MSIALTNGIGDFYFQVGARPVVCCFTRLPCTARPTVSLGKTQIGYWISRRLTSRSAAGMLFRFICVISRGNAIINRPFITQRDKIGSLVSFTVRLSVTIIALTDVPHHLGKYGL